MAALFFAWGFICANNDPLIAAFRHLFGLSYTEALLTQIVFFLAFASMSLPAAAVLARLGPAMLLRLGLGVICAGCVLVQLVRWAHGFEIVLLGLFFIATGVVGLQVAANPLAARLGDSRHSHFRLTLAHALNSIGVVCGGLFGARFILGTSAFEGGEAVSAADRAAGSQAIANAYGLIALLTVALLTVVTLGLRRREAEPAKVAPGSAGLVTVLHSRWALAGAFGISAYVGAEVTIGSLLTPYLAGRGGMSLARAGAYVATLYWGGALVGRLVGSWLLRSQPAPRLLALAAGVAALLCVAGIALPGTAAPWCLVAVGLCNSIMFPTIFSLTLERSDAGEAAISGALCFAIGAGALVPLLAGTLADTLALATAFSAPLVCYLYILGFARRCRGPAPHGRRKPPGVGRAPGRRLRADRVTDRSRTARGAGSAANGDIAPGP